MKVYHEKTVLAELNLAVGHDHLRESLDSFCHLAQFVS